jgi:hypothetical protein
MSIAIAAAMMSAATLTSTMAQAQFSEPAAFQAANPNRDVLNGGQLTPAGRAALGQPQYEGASGAYASQNYPASGAPVVRSRRHRWHQ